MESLHVPWRRGASPAEKAEAIRAAARDELCGIGTAGSHDGGLLGDLCGWVTAYEPVEITQKPQRHLEGSTDSACAVTSVTMGSNGHCATTRRHVVGRGVARKVGPLAMAGRCNTTVGVTTRVV